MSSTYTAYCFLPDKARFDLGTLADGLRRTFAAEGGVVVGDGAELVLTLRDGWEVSYSCLVDDAAAEEIGWLVAHYAVPDPTTALRCRCLITMSAPLDVDEHYNDWVFAQQEVEAFDAAIVVDAATLDRRADPIAASGDGTAAATPARPGLLARLFGGRRRGR